MKSKDNEGCSVSEKQTADNSTLEYYSRNAADFVSSTRQADFSAVQNRFLSLLDHKGEILDLGCGSGRDARAFLDAGYTVRAVDGFPAMAQLACSYLGMPVDTMDFEDLIDQERYEGIWACASLLHVPCTKLPTIFAKVYQALKTGGIFYCSFKLGNFEGVRNGRYFTDLDACSLQELLQAGGRWKVEDVWISEDVRPDHTDEKWINGLFRKTEL